MNASEPIDNAENRNVTDWIQSYLEYTDDQEAPEQIHFWTGMAVLGAALRRQVYTDRVFYKLYPNLYIVVVAPSATARKSVAEETGISLLRKAVPNIFILSGRITPEGLTKNMNRTSVSHDDPLKSKVLVESHTLIHADELATLFGYDRQMASRMSILLTEIYSCKDEYNHITKNDAPVCLKFLYPTLLAATDPLNLKVLPEDAIGGLIGRTIFVAAGKKRKRPVQWDPSDKLDKLHNALLVDLARISSLRGQFMVEQSARVLYDEWYDKFSEVEVSDARISAFHARAHDLALKIAMLVSVSRSNKLVITESHVATGIAIVEKQVPEFAKLMSWAGTSLYAQNRARVLDLLLRNNGAVTRKQVMRSMALSADEIDLLQKSLEQEGTIETTLLKTEIVWKLSPDEVIRIRTGE